MKKHLYFVVLLFLSSLVMAQKGISQNRILKPMQTYWSLRGNSNLNDTVNFLGTTDEHRLFFRVNNKLSGFIDYDSFARNTTYGYQTLVNLSPYGFDNTAIGYQAMRNSTDGHANIALGVRTLYNNTLVDDFTLLDHAFRKVLININVDNQASCWSLLNIISGLVK